MKKERKKNRTNIENLIKKFDNETHSAVISDSLESQRVVSLLKSNNISYSIGDIPKMKDGKVIGCFKQITILDSEALYNAINRISKSDYEGEE